MDFKQVLGVLRGPYTILPDIPAGRKDGMFFIINNAPNADKRQNGTRSEFWDDCDANLLHTNSSIEAYSTFMHDVADNLTDYELSQLTIDSEEELSFKTSIKRCFPGSSHILFTSLLK